MAPFAATLFVSAALLFMVQPMAARRALPVLGGTPAVWTASMLFFQVVLLAGYGYAHLLGSRLGLRRQIAVHALVVLAPFAALALLPAPAPPAPGASPVPWLLAMLGSTIGLPFFALSTTASLLQRWFSLGDPRDPYPLYAASNLGSLAGLFAYPLVVEPFLALDRQRALWSAGYGVFAAFAAACAVRAWRCGEPKAAREVWAEEPKPPGQLWAGWADRLRWTALAAAPSSLLLGATQHITTDLAPFPLLWILPLAFYLLSYVVAFSPRPLIPHRWALLLQPILLVPLALLLPWEVDIPGLVLSLALPLHLASFFATALVCHGELAARRPGVSGLTEFYLCLALGGALGGAFNALAAPALFRTPIEYPLVLALACLLRPGPGPRPLNAWRVVSLPLGFLLIGSVTLMQRWVQRQDEGGGWRAAMVGAGTLLIAPLLYGHPLRLTLGAAALLVTGAAAADRGPEILHRDRSFFGAHQVERTKEGRRFLVHGRILHGSQEEDPARRRLPMSYYHRSGPCGRMFQAFASRIPGGRVGVLGLGAGMLASYGLPGQRWTFFEIDPAIERTARAWFTYLSDCPAELDVRIGDGRLGLERAAPGEFGLILLDAFSSDSVPVHLLTKEAVELYFERLAPGGLLAFHVSNRFVDLIRLLGGHAARGRWAGLVADEPAFPPKAENEGWTRSTWVLLARRPVDLRPFVTDEIWDVLPADPEAPAWTDAHSSVLPYLKIR